MNIKKQELQFINKVNQLPSKPVELYLDSPEDLIDSNNFAGPESFTLKSEVIEYLDQQAREISIKNSIEIKIHFRKGSEDNGIDCEKIIHDYYAKELDRLIAEHKQNTKHWQFRFFTGLIFLACCNAVIILLSNLWDSKLSSLIQQGLEVLGCVALWEPATYFLFSRKDEGLDITDYFQLKHSKITVQQ